MTILNPAEISQMKASLVSYPKAIAALQEIEDCDGNTEDAAISLALKSGQEPDSHGQWLAGFSKRYRHIVCQTDLKAALQTGQLLPLIQQLTRETDCPELLAAPVAIYIAKSGIENFCYSFEHSRV